MYAAEWIPVENHATAADWKFYSCWSEYVTGSRARGRAWICAWRAGRILGEGFDGLIQNLGDDFLANYMQYE